MNDAGKKAPPPVSSRNAGERQQARALATRRALVSAARRTFARDGFDLTRLEDIATVAGKTRGAFYANFKDKEDVFFAIFEEDLRRHKAAMRERLVGTTTSSERVDVVARELLALVKDRRRMLLGMEFKLYAIRHPKRQKRLAELHAAMCLRCAEKGIDELLPELGHANPEQKRQQAALFGSVLEGLTLNRLFAPSALDDELMLALLRSTVEIAMERARES